MNKKQKTIFITLAVVIIIVLIAIFLFPELQERRAEQERIEEIEVYYPEPSEVIKEITGVVQGIRGATIVIEINDPENHLPDQDGNIAKINKFVSVSENTEIRLLTINNQGDVEKAPVTIADIQEDDEIYVDTTDNIREVDKINADLIEIIRY